MEGLILLGLKKVRKHRALSQADAAKALGFSRQVFCNYENGKRAPSYETLTRMSVFFNVSIDYLINGNDYINARPSNEEHAREIINALIEIGYIKPNEDISRKKKTLYLISSSETRISSLRERMKSARARIAYSSSSKPASKRARINECNSLIVITPAFIYLAPDA